MNVGFRKDLRRSTRLERPTIERVKSAKTGHTESATAELYLVDLTVSARSAAVVARFLYQRTHEIFPPGRRVKPVPLDAMNNGTHVALVAVVIFSA